MERLISSKRYIKDLMNSGMTYREAVDHNASIVDEAWEEEQRKKRIPDDTLTELRSINEKLDQLLKLLG